MHQTTLWIPHKKVPKTFRSHNVSIKTHLRHQHTRLVSQNEITLPLWCFIVGVLPMKANCSLQRVQFAPENVLKSNLKCFEDFSRGEIKINSIAKWLGSVQSRVISSDKQNKPFGKKNGCALLIPAS